MSCGWCQKDFPEIDGEWLVNPEGGFGRRELWICDGCIVMPENRGVADRLLDGWPRDEGGMQLRYELQRLIKEAA